MSDYERNVGKLIQVRPDLSIENACKTISGNFGWELGGHESYSQLVEDEGYRKYHINDGKLYLIDGGETEDRDEYYDARKEGGVIHFDVRFYNGGCSLSEALDSAIKTLNLAEVANGN